MGFGFVSILLSSFVQNLTSWGSALIELSQFEKVDDAKKMTRGIYLPQFVCIDIPFT